MVPGPVALVVIPVGPLAGSSDPPLVLEIVSRSADVVLSLLGTDKLHNVPIFVIAMRSVVLSLYLH